MVQGIPYDSPEGRAQRRRHRPSCTGAAYATSAEMAAEMGRSPAIEANRDAMLRVIRNHRRAAYMASRPAYEGLDHHAGRASTPTKLPARPLLSRAPKAWDRCAGAGREARLPQRPGHGASRPTGTIGLVMDCDTTGIEPDFALVKFKKLAGGGYFKIINESVPPALAPPRLRRRPEIEDIVGYCRRPRHARKARPPSTTSRWRRKGFNDDAQARSSALPAAFEHPLRLQPLDPGRRVLPRAARPHRRAARDPGFDLLARLGFTKSRSRRPTTTSAAR